MNPGYVPFTVFFIMALLSFLQKTVANGIKKHKISTKNQQIACFEKLKLFC